MEVNRQRLSKLNKTIQRGIENVTLAQTKERCEKEISNLERTVLRAEKLVNRMEERNPSGVKIKEVEDYLRLINMVSKILEQKLISLSRKEMENFEEIQIVTTDSEGKEQVQVVKKINHKEENFDLQEEEMIDQLLQDTKDFVEINQQVSDLLEIQGKKISKTVEKNDKATDDVIKGAKDIQDSHALSMKKVVLVSGGVGTVLGLPVGLASLAFAPYLTIPAMVLTAGLGGTLGLGSGGLYAAISKRVSQVDKEKLEKVDKNSEK